MKFSFDRQYLGVTVTAENYRKILEGPGGRDELRFHAKHLKAYLRGNDGFYHGTTTGKYKDPVSGEERETAPFPKWNKVQQLIKVWYLNPNMENVSAQLTSQKDLNNYLEKVRKEWKEQSESAQEQEDMI